MPLEKWGYRKYWNNFFKIFLQSLGIALPWCSHLKNDLTLRENSFFNWSQDLMLPSTLKNWLAKFVFHFEKSLKWKESFSILIPLSYHKNYGLIELGRLGKCEKKSLHEINILLWYMTNPLERNLKPLMPGGNKKVTHT